MANAAVRMLVTWRPTQECNAALDRRLKALVLGGIDMSNRDVAVASLWVTCFVVHLRRKYLNIPANRRLLPFSWKGIPATFTREPARGPRVTSQFQQKTTGSPRRPADPARSPATAAAAIGSRGYRRKAARRRPCGPSHRGKPG